MCVNVHTAGNVVVPGSLTDPDRHGEAYTSRGCGCADDGGARKGERLVLHSETATGRGTTLHNSCIFLNYDSIRRP